MTLNPSTVKYHAVEMQRSHKLVICVITCSFLVMTCQIMSLFNNLPISRHPFIQTIALNFYSPSSPLHFTSYKQFLLAIYVHMAALVLFLVLSFTVEFRRRPLFGYYFTCIITVLDYLCLTIFIVPILNLFLPFTYLAQQISGNFVSEIRSVTYPWFIVYGTNAIDDYDDIMFSADPAVSKANYYVPANFSILKFVEWRTIMCNILQAIVICAVLLAYLIWIVTFLFRWGTTAFIGGIYSPNQTIGFIILYVLTLTGLTFYAYPYNVYTDPNTLSLIIALLTLYLVVHSIIRPPFLNIYGSAAASGILSLVLYMSLASYHTFVVGYTPPIWVNICGPFGLFILAYTVSLHRNTILIETTICYLTAQRCDLSSNINDALLASKESTSRPASSTFSSIARTDKRFYEPFSPIVIPAPHSHFFAVILICFTVSRILCFVKTMIVWFMRTTSHCIACCAHTLVPSVIKRRANVPVVTSRVYHSFIKKLQHALDAHILQYLTKVFASVSPNVSTESYLYRFMQITSGVSLPQYAHLHRVVQEGRVGFLDAVFMKSYVARYERRIRHVRNICQAVLATETTKGTVVVPLKYKEDLLIVLTYLIDFYTRVLISDFFRGESTAFAGSSQYYGFVRQLTLVANSKWPGCPLPDILFIGVLITSLANYHLATESIKELLLTYGGKERREISDTLGRIKSRTYTTRRQTLEEIESHKVFILRFLQENREVCSYYYSDKINIEGLLETYQRLKRFEEVRGLSLEDIYASSTSLEKAQEIIERKTDSDKLTSVLKTREPSSLVTTLSFSDYAELRKKFDTDFCALYASISTYLEASLAAHLRHSETKWLSLETSEICEALSHRALIQTHGNAQNERDLTRRLPLFARLSLLRMTQSTKFTEDVEYLSELQNKIVEMWNGRLTQFLRLFGGPVSDTPSAFSSLLTMARSFDESLRDFYRLQRSLNDEAIYTVLQHAYMSFLPLYESTSKTYRKVLRKYRSVKLVYTTEGLPIYITRVVARLTVLKTHDVVSNNVESLRMLSRAHSATNVRANNLSQSSRYLIFSTDASTSEKMAQSLTSSNELLFGKRKASDSSYLIDGAATSHLRNPTALGPSYGSYSQSLALMRGQAFHLTSVSRGFWLKIGLAISALSTFSVAYICAIGISIANIPTAHVLVPNLRDLFTFYRSASVFSLFPADTSYNTKLILMKMVSSMKNMHLQKLFPERPIFIKHLPGMAYTIADSQTETDMHTELYERMRHIAECPYDTLQGYIAYFARMAAPLRFYLEAVLQDRALLSVVERSFGLSLFTKWQVPTMIAAYHVCIVSSSLYFFYMVKNILRRDLSIIAEIYRALPYDARKATHRYWSALNNRRLRFYEMFMGNLPAYCQSILCGAIDSHAPQYTSSTQKTKDLRRLLNRHVILNADEDQEDIHSFDDNNSPIAQSTVFDKDYVTTQGGFGTDYWNQSMLLQDAGSRGTAPNAQSLSLQDPAAMAALDSGQSDANKSGACPRESSRRTSLVSSRRVSYSMTSVLRQSSLPLNGTSNCSDKHINSTRLSRALRSSGKNTSALKKTLTNALSFLQCLKPCHNARKLSGTLQRNSLGSTKTHQQNSRYATALIFLSLAFLFAFLYTIILFRDVICAYLNAGKRGAMFLEGLLAIPDTEALGSIVRAYAFNGDDTLYDMYVGDSGYEALEGRFQKLLLSPHNQMARSWALVQRLGEYQAVTLELQRLNNIALFLARISYTNSTADMFNQFMTREILEAKNYGYDSWCIECELSDPRTLRSQITQSPEYFSVYRVLANTMPEYNSSSSDLNLNASFQKLMALGTLSSPYYRVLVERRRSLLGSTLFELEACRGLGLLYEVEGDDTIRPPATKWFSPRYLVRSFIRSFIKSILGQRGYIFDSPDDQFLFRNQVIDRSTASTNYLHPRAVYSIQPHDLSSANLELLNDVIRTRLTSSKNTQVPDSTSFSPTDFGWLFIVTARNLAILCCAVSVLFVLGASAFLIRTRKIGYFSVRILVCVLLNTILLLLVLLLFYIHVYYYHPLTVNSIDKILKMNTNFAVLREDMASTVFSVQLAALNFDKIFIRRALSGMAHYTSYEQLGYDPLYPEFFSYNFYNNVTRPSVVFPDGYDDDVLRISEKFPSLHEVVSWNGYIHHGFNMLLSFLPDNYAHEYASQNKAAANQNREHFMKWFALHQQDNNLGHSNPILNLRDLLKEPHMDMNGSLFRYLRNTTCAIEAEYFYETLSALPQRMLYFTGDIRKALAYIILGMNSSIVNTTLETFESQVNLGFDYIFNVPQEFVKALQNPDLPRDIPVFNFQKSSFYINRRQNIHGFFADRLDDNVTEAISEQQKLVMTILSHTGTTLLGDSDDDFARMTDSDRLAKLYIAGLTLSLGRNLVLDMTDIVASYNSIFVTTMNEINSLFDHLYITDAYVSREYVIIESFLLFTLLIISILAAFYSASVHLHLPLDCLRRSILDHYNLITYSMFRKVSPLIFASDIMFHVGFWLSLIVVVVVFTFIRILHKEQGDFLLVETHIEDLRNEHLMTQTHIITSYMCLENANCSLYEFLERINKMMCTYERFDKKIHELLIFPGASMPHYPVQSAKATYGVLNSAILDRPYFFGSRDSASRSLGFLSSNVLDSLFRPLKLPPVECIVEKNVLRSLQYDSIFSLIIDLTFDNVYKNILYSSANLTYSPDTRGLIHALNQLGKSFECIYGQIFEHQTSRNVYDMFTDSRYYGLNSTEIGYLIKKNENIRKNFGIGLQNLMAIDMFLDIMQKGMTAVVQDTIWTRRIYIIVCICIWVICIVLICSATLLQLKVCDRVSLMRSMLRKIPAEQFKLLHPCYSILLYNKADIMQQ